MEIPRAFSQLFERTLRIETNEGSGSSFVINHEGQPWLVTARHVIEDRRGNEKLFDVYQQDGQKHSGLLRLRQTSGADVAVFRMWTHELDFGPPAGLYRASDLKLDQDVHLIGYPDLGDPSVFHLKYQSRSTPFIKRASVSGEADYYGLRVWLLDGLITFGFSGGPIVAYSPEKDCFQVLGVTSSYVPANVSVMPPRVCFASAAPGAAPPPPNDSFFQGNSGLVIGFDIQHAIDIIDAHLSNQAHR